MLGEKLSELRSEKKMTQVEVADKFGIHSATVSAWEKNKALPNLNDLVRLAKLYDVTPDYLLGFKSDKDNELKTALLKAGINELEFEYALQQIELFRKFKN